MDSNDRNRNMLESTRPTGGRTHQKERTRSAIVAAALEVVESESEVTMRVIADRARVSEATAYRYFPDLVSLLRVTIGSTDLLDDMKAVEQTRDPVDRVGHATGVLARGVLRRQGARSGP